MVTKQLKLKIDWVVPKEYSLESGSKVKWCDTCSADIEFWKDALPLIRNLVVIQPFFQLFIRPPWLICDSCQMKFRIARGQTELDFEFAVIAYKSIILPLAKEVHGIEVSFEFGYEESTSI